MLTHRYYTASIWVDEDTGLICGRVDNISRDSLSFQGKIYEEAKQDFIKTIDDYLEFCKSENIQPEAPAHFSGKLPFRTTPSTHQAIAYKAKQAGKSINAWLEEVAIKALSKPTPKQIEQDEPVGTSPRLIDQVRSQPNLTADFFDRIASHLINGGPIGTLNFLDAIEKALPGLKAIKSHLKAPNPEVVGKVVSEIEAWAQKALVDSEKPASNPFVKEEQETGQVTVRKI